MRDSDPIRAARAFVPPLSGALCAAALVSVAACSSADAGTPAAIAPAPRSGYALAYDAAGDRIVLFGGMAVTDSGTARAGDTWEWRDGVWREIRGAGPPPRSDAQMAWDARRGRVVLFGGGGGDGRLADTWELRGDRWTRVAGAGPPARNLSAMAYDAADGRTVLFGGSGDGRIRLRDTWTWDGAAWRDVSPGVSPPARGAHAMTWDAAGRRVLLYGGYSDGPHADLWAWDGTAWAPIATSAAPPRLHTALGFDEARGRVVLFGGFGEGGREADTWELVEDRWTRVASEGPGGRAEHEGVWVPGTGFVVFGGVVGQEMAEGERRRANDLWAWDGTAWRRLGS